MILSTHDRPVHSRTAPRFRGLRRAADALRREPLKVLVLAISLALFTWFVLYPFALLVGRSFLQPGTSRWTLDNYAAFFAQAGLWSAFVNTLILGAGCLVLSLLVGVPMAWGVARTNMPCREFVQTMAALTLATPSFLSALAWILLLGPRAGSLNLLARELFGLDRPFFNIYSMGGLVFVLGLFLYPFVFFAATAALQSLDPRLEEAAEIHGSTQLGAALRVAGPLILPAILSGTILVVLEAFAVFGAPAVIGLPARFRTLSTQIYTFFYFPPQFEMAAVAAVPMVLLIALLLWLQRTILGRRQYVVVGGTAGYARRLDFGSWRIVLAAFCLAVIGVSIFLPFGALLVVSLKRIVGLPLAWDNFTLRHYRSVLVDSLVFRRSVLNSFVLAVAAATLCTAFSALLGWMVEKAQMVGRECIQFLMLLSLSLPGIAVAIGLVFAFSGPPMNLYGTLWIILVAYTIRGVPLAFLHARDAYRQVGDELLEASQILGASWLRAVRDVAVPLAKRGLLAGWILVFVLMLRELGASILLFTGDNQVVAVTIYQAAEEGDFGPMAALSVLVLFVTGILVLSVRRAVGSGRLEG